MFENSILYCVLNDGEIKKCELSKSISNLRVFFENLFEKYEEEYNQTPYVFGYKNEPHELSYVPYSLNPYIIQVIRDASSLPVFSINQDLDNLKYVFMGEYLETQDGAIERVVFQRIHSNQVIKPDNRFIIRATSDGNVLSSLEGDFFAIDERFDCYFNNGDLIFNSIYNARKIFDMSEFIKEASDDEVKSFANFELFSCDEAGLLELADTPARGNIKSVLDKGILSHCTVELIQEMAEKANLIIETEEIDESICILLPTNKKDFKIFLKILDEKIYEGRFSGDLQESNSTRPYIFS